MALRASRRSPPRPHTDIPISHPGLPASDPPCTNHKPQTTNHKSQITNHFPSAPRRPELVRLRSVTFSLGNGYEEGIDRCPAEIAGSAPMKARHLLHPWTGCRRTPE